MINYVICMKGWQKGYGANNDICEKSVQRGRLFRVRDFLKYTLYEDPSRKNWLIDRWNFGRYFSQTMHGTFDTWPETVGLWEDESNEIIAVVNSE